MIETDKITKNSIYNKMPVNIATQRMNDLLKLIELFLQKSTLSEEDVEFNAAILLKIVTRIDQRSDYFIYFHSDIRDDGTIEVDEMSQYKQIALLCFWIMKYKPLRIKDHQKDLIYYCKNRCTINETFAAYLFTSQIIASSNVTKSQKKYYKSRQYIADLFYKFMHHDISKEAMIFSLCSIVGCK